MPNVYIDEAKFSALITEVDELINSIEKDFNDLTLEYKKTNEESDNWKGEAQKAFQEKKEKVVNKYPLVIAKLKEYKNTMQTALDNYKIKEGKITSAVDSDLTSIE